MKVLGFALVAFASLARADYAVVVGVQEYVMPSANTLRGAVNDAEDVAAALKKRGFNVKVLLNKDATEKGILDALDEAKGKVKTGERFVFYFAGHGRREPIHALMPHDATKDSNDVSTEELYAAIEAIQAASRTVILDACFSGGMIRGAAKGFRKLTPRFWKDPDRPRPSAALAKSFGAPTEDASAQESMEHLIAGTDVCYYAAAKPGETAMEEFYGDRAHGIFTYSLLQQLSQNAGTWNDVHLKVKLNVQERLEGSGLEQNPTISADYISTPLFAPAPSRPKPVTMGSDPSLLDLYNLDQVDESRLRIRIEPNRSHFRVGEQFRFSVQNESAGYLVILGKTGDRHYLVHPASGQVESAFLPAGSDFPRGGGLSHINSAGMDRIKALLFERPSEAKALIDAMRSFSTRPSVSEMQAKRLPTLREPAIAASASVTLIAEPMLMGGAKIKDPYKMLGKLIDGKQPFPKLVWSRFDRSDREALEAVALAGAPLDERAEARLIAALNRVMQGATLADRDALKGVRLRRETRDRMDRADDVLELNRLLLEDAFRDDLDLEEGR